MNSLITTAAAGLAASQCPTGYPVQADFDASRYVGTWFEIQRDGPGTVFEYGSQCVTATYTAHDDGSIGVANRSWQWWTLAQYYTIKGDATCEGAKCTVDFFNQHNAEPNYNVIATDYETYSIVYNCEKALG